jgi:hypothetical protein
MKKIWKQTIDLRKLTASDSSIMQELPQQARIVHAAISPASGLEDLLDFWFEFTWSFAGCMSSERVIRYRMDFITVRRQWEHSSSGICTSDRE